MRSFSHFLLLVCTEAAFNYACILYDKKESQEMTDKSREYLSQYLPENQWPSARGILMQGCW